LREELRPQHPELFEPTAEEVTAFKAEPEGAGVEEVFREEPPPAWLPKIVPDLKGKLTREKRWGFIPDYEYRARYAVVAVVMWFCSWKVYAKELQESGKRPVEELPPLLRELEVSVGREAYACAPLFFF